jgi:phosphatidylserine decarboxylase
VPLSPEGLPFILAGVFVTVITAILGSVFLTIVFLAVTLLMLNFFRDPERIITSTESEVTSPADGKVVAVERVEEPQFTHKRCWKISIFMNVFNVHVNRAPYSGTIKGIHFRKGRFFAASNLTASRENEQNWVWIQDNSGNDVVLTQVAGLVARRIVCWPQVGDELIRGERFGMIRFGSRLDVYVPEASEVTVSKGDHVFAGESVLCKMR